MKDLPSDDPVRGKVIAAGDTVTSIVGFLATGFPDPVVNDLMLHTWHVIGSGKAQVAMYDVPTPHVVVVQDGGNILPTVLIPPDWITAVIRDPIMASGAMVFCGSQVVDSWNGRLKSKADSEAARMRALIYEAQYLLALRRIHPPWKPNSYQQEVLGSYPDGVTTPTATSLLYERRPHPLSPPPAALA